MAYTGKFRPRNPAKYKGDYTNIIYRSSWELRCMKYFDSNSNILRWQSEEFYIPYKSPIDQRWHRYFPDFLITARQNNGTVETILIEVKPYKQTIRPKTQQRITQRYITEVRTWGINSYKWAAAKKHCAQKGWKFQIITEHELRIAKYSRNGKKIKSKRTKAKH